MLPGLRCRIRHTARTGSQGRRLTSLMVSVSRGVRGTKERPFDPDLPSSGADAGVVVDVVIGAVIDVELGVAGEDAE